MRSDCAIASLQRAMQGVMALEETEATPRSVVYLVADDMIVVLAMACRVVRGCL